jgi:hypothetical protein
VLNAAGFGGKPVQLQAPAPDDEHAANVEWIAVDRGHASAQCTRYLDSTGQLLSF